MENSFILEEAGCDFSKLQKWPLHDHKSLCHRCREYPNIILHLLCRIVSLSVHTTKTG